MAIPFIFSATTASQTIAPVPRVQPLKPGSYFGQIADWAHGWPG